MDNHTHIGHLPFNHLLLINMLNEYLIDILSRTSYIINVKLHDVSQQNAIKHMNHKKVHSINLQDNLSVWAPLEIVSQC